MMDRKEPKPIYKMETEEERRMADGSITLQGVYQRYWEEKDRDRRMERRRNSRGLSIYERARESGYPDHWKQKVL